MPSSSLPVPRHATESGAAPSDRDDERTTAPPSYERASVWE